MNKIVKKKKAAVVNKKEKITADLEIIIKSIINLLQIIERLRNKKNGCAWDIQQTNNTLKNSLIEETYEAIQAIEDNDSLRISEELGDLLFVVLMHLYIGNEDGILDFKNSVQSISEKLIRRHPHVFSNLKLDSSDEILQNWENIKRSEKKNKDTISLLNDIPRSMPALLRFARVFNKLDRLNELKIVIQKNSELVKYKKQIDSNLKSTEKNKKDIYMSMLSALCLSAFENKINLEDEMHSYINEYIKIADN